MKRHRGSWLIANAVLCGNGKVTNVRILRGLNAEINEKYINAIRKVKFTPAKKNGQNVSQTMGFELQL